MDYFSVCSGIEAATVAWHPLGWRAVGFSEIEKFPSQVLAHHYPEVQNYGDFTTAKLKYQVDVLVGGTPCQSFSLAGLRKSLDDDRGNLALSYVKLAHELADENGLEWAVWENVPGVLSTKDNAFGCFLAGLVGSSQPFICVGRWPKQGMVAGPKGKAAWRVFDAQHFGLAQRRKRVFVVANFGNGDPAEVLFERKSLQGNPSPRRKTREEIAAAINSGSEIGGYTPPYCVELADTLTVGANQCTGFPSPEVVAFTSINDGGDATEGPTPTLTCGGGGGYGVGMAVAYTFDVKRGLAPSRAAQESDTAFPLTATDYKDPQLVRIAYPIDTMNHIGRKDTHSLGDFVANGPSYTLTKGHSHGVAVGSVVRRLTPRECERLQGFPDDYTLVPTGKGIAADSHRYKALGNSMAIPCMTWIGKRIDLQAKRIAANDNNQPLRAAA